MKKNIIISGLVFIIVCGIFVYFVGNISSVYPPLKKYKYYGDANQFLSGVKRFTSSNSNLSFKITDTTGNIDDYAIYFIIITKYGSDEIRYDLNCEKINKYTTRVNLIGAHNVTNKKGGYHMSDLGVKEMVNDFDTSILSKMKKEQKISIVPL